MNTIPSVSRDRFEARRNVALDRLGRGVMVLPAAPIQHASRDTERRYVPDRELFYLTGVTEPGALAVLVGGNDPRTVLFVRDRDPEAELWAGPRVGPEAMADLTGIAECHPESEMAEKLPELLSAGDRIHYRPGRPQPVESIVFGSLERARARGCRTGSGPRGLVDPGEILDELRLVKDSDELEAIRAACELTVAGHLEGAAVIAPGAGEWAVEAAIDATFRSQGGTGVGFETIVGSGENACVLHYVANSAIIEQDALVLVDAGAERMLYNGDVTRTYPSSGAFSPLQAEVYDIVDSARAAAIDVARPGVTIAEVHDAATRLLTCGLLELGALEGDVDDLLETEAYKVFFPHQTSHWLGLDVHDPGDYARDGSSRVLEPGMVLTIEPGLYFRPALSNEGAERLTGIGVRIEDDIAIDEDGCEVLTAALPTSRTEVEALVSSGHGSPA